MIDDAQLIQHFKQNTLISEADLQHAQKLQMLEGGMLYDILMEHNSDKEKHLVDAAADILGVQCVHLDQFEFDAQATELLSASMAERNHVFPLTIQQDDGRRELILAMTDPIDIMTMDEIASHTGVDIQPVLAGKKAIERAIKRAYSQPSAPSSDDPFAHLDNIAASHRNPEDSWAAFFDEAQEQAPREDAANISQEMRDRRNSGPFESVSQAPPELAQDDSEPILDLDGWQVNEEEEEAGQVPNNTPPALDTNDVNDDSNIFGQFLADDSEHDEQFNGTMLGSPLRSLSGSSRASEASEAEISEGSNEPEAEENAFDLFAPASSMAEEQVESEASEANNFTQLGVGTAQHSVIRERPKSNPKAKKLETLRKRLKNKGDAAPKQPEVLEEPSVPTPLDFNLDSIVQEAAQAFDDEISEPELSADELSEMLEEISESEAHLSTDNAPAGEVNVDAQAPQTPPKPDAQPPQEPQKESDTKEPKVTNALGRLQLKKISIPKKPILPNKIVEKDARKPKDQKDAAQPKPTQASKTPKAMTPQQAILTPQPQQEPPAAPSTPAQPKAPLDAAIIIEEDSDPEELPMIDEFSEVSEVHVAKRPNMLGALLEPSEVYDKSQKFESRAITGTSSTLDPADLSAPSEQSNPSEGAVEEMAALEEEIPEDRTAQPTEANAALTIEHVQQMQSEPDPLTMDVLDLDIESEESSEVIEDPAPPTPPQVIDARVGQQTLSNPAITIEHVQQMKANEVSGNQTRMQFHSTSHQAKDNLLPAHLSDHQLIRAIAHLLIKRGYFTHQDLIAQAEDLPEHESLSEEQITALAKKLSNIT